MSQLAVQSGVCTGVQQDGAASTIWVEWPLLENVSSAILILDAVLWSGDSRRQ